MDGRAGPEQLTLAALGVSTVVAAVAVAAAVALGRELGLLAPDYVAQDDGNAGDGDDQYYHCTYHHHYRIQRLICPSHVLYFSVEKVGPTSFGMVGPTYWEQRERILSWGTDLATHLPPPSRCPGNSASLSNSHFGISVASSVAWDQ